MEETAIAFQHWLAVCGLIAGVAFFVAFAVIACKDGIAEAWRRATQGKRHRQLLAAAFVCVAFYLGAAKPSGSHVSYDGGIRAGATANVITNDTVSIYWQRDTASGVIVPESATVYIDYRPNNDSNAVDWVSLAETTVGAWGWSGTVANATNYDYNVWAYYIPPEPIHTNGVWTYKTMRDRPGRYILPLRARVEVNGEAIATPKEKRKERTE